MSDEQQNQEEVSLPTDVQVGAILATNQEIAASVGGIAAHVGGIGPSVDALVPIFREQNRILEAMAVAEEAYVTLVVTLETRDGATVTGQTVSLYEGKDTATGALRETKPYHGESIYFNVPKGMRYFIVASDTFTTRQDGIYDHFAPTTASGTALIGAEIELEYRDADNIESLTEFAVCEEAIKAQYATDEERIAAGLELLVGVELPDTWIKDDGTTSVSDPWIVADFCEQTGEDDQTFIGATLMRKWATANSVMFDNRNQEYAGETVAQEGVDYYGYATPAFSESATYAQYKSVIYDGAWWMRSASGTLPAGEWNEANWSLVGYLTDGAIPEFSEEATYAESTLVWRYDPDTGDTRIYKCTTEVTEAGSWTGTANWSWLGGERLEADMVKLSATTGEALDRSGYVVVYRTSLSASGNYVKNAIRYGHNNWGASAYRQYLNSAGDKGEWWTQQHTGQIAPSNLYTVRGYMAGCSAELLGLIKKTKVLTYANSNTDSAQGAYTTLDTFFLPSCSQVCGNVNANEGHAFPYLVQYYIEGLEGRGLTVRDYDAETEGEVGVIYVNRATGQFYTWRPDTSGYSNFTNDDGSWFREYKTKTIESVATNADRGSDASKVYFVAETQKMWRVDGASWKEMSHEWYMYCAVGKPTTGTTTPLNAERRRFSVTNHSSAAFCRLRSAYRSNAHNAWYITTTGYLNYYHAYYACAGVPACVI